MIPKRFEEIIKQNTRLYANVLNTISVAEKILTDNKLEFFPEYTDHGMQHIKNVLNLAEKVISEESYRELTANDIHAIITSILLHDIGMHIKYDGFKQLIESAEEVKINATLVDSSWSEEWNKYMKEVQLWNDNKKKLIFGEVVHIKEIPQNYLEFNNYHRLLCGEFIRRHHARLAHQIIVRGFPTRDGEYLQIISNLDSNIKDIVGMISRSHGMNIWEALSYTEKIWNKQSRNIMGINIIFVMVVLRISDYFDIDNSRANSIILSTHKLRSVISDIEWSKQNCIEYINFSHQDDPELAYVHVSTPATSLIFLENNKLIKDIQQELDVCWAVLGKVYGRIIPLGLTIRRIKSNLEEIENFYDSLDYIPERVTFTSEKGILNLLVRPLYGDNPSYGIRELIQNAVDACIEKYKLVCEEKIGSYKPEIIVKIVVEKDDKYYVIVKDNGMGMSKDIILNYFLKAGATYRRSNEWREKYIDGSNKSKVVRSGKFGVGAMASFILGDKINVKTKGYFCNEIYEFTTTIDTNQIEIKKTFNIEEESGTEIKIYICEETYNRLKKGYFADNRNYKQEVPWNNWYYLEFPELTIEVPEDWVDSRYISKIKVSLEQSQLDDDWYSFSVEGLTRVDWKYCERGYNHDKYGLFCNGICIPGGYHFNIRTLPSDLDTPIVSIIDKDGNLPLTLDRNDISGKSLPFENKLIEEIQKYIMAKVLIYTNISVFTDELIIVRDTKLKHLGLKNYGYSTPADYKIVDTDFILNKEGYYLPFLMDFNEKEIKKITKIWINNNVENITIEDINMINKLDDIIFSFDSPNAIYDYRNIFEMDRVIETHNKIQNNYKVIGKTIIIKSEKFNYLFAEGKKRMTKAIETSMTIEDITDKWTIVTIGEVNESLFDVNTFDNYIEEFSLIVTYYICANDESSNNEINENIYDKYMKNNKFIPYELEHRKECFKDAFMDLNNNMKQ